MNIDVIKAARDRIADGYWHKGAARSLLDPEKACVITTLSEIAMKLGLNATDMNEVIRFVERLAPVSDRPGSLRPLAAFNDDPTTSRQDVVDVFDKALAELGGLG